MKHARFMPRLLMGISTLCLSIYAAHAADRMARQRLDAFAKGLHTLSGHFTQSVMRTAGQPGQISSGTLALQAPHKFRWETQTPYKQLIVADGHRIWMYDPDLAQVTVRKQGLAEAHSPLTVLTDMTKLDTRFKVSDRGKHDGLAWLRLRASGVHRAFDYVDLGFDRYGLARMTLRDQLGTVTHIRFSTWHRNPVLAAKTFHFKPPKGVDVVGDGK